MQACFFVHTDHQNPPILSIYPILSPRDPDLDLDRDLECDLDRDLCDDPDRDLERAGDADLGLDPAHTQRVEE